MCLSLCVCMPVCMPVCVCVYLLLVSIVIARALYTAFTPFGPRSVEFRSGSSGASGCHEYGT